MLCNTWLGSRDVEKRIKYKYQKVSAQKEIRKCFELSVQVNLVTKIKIKSPDAE